MDFLYVESIGFRACKTTAEPSTAMMAVMVVNPTIQVIHVPRKILIVVVA